MKNLFIFIILILSITFLSCNNDDLVTNNDLVIEKETKIDETEAKRDFSLALSKALSESEDFRNILKDEALKQFNYDYDVLYALLKNNTLKTGETIEDLFLKYIEKDKLLQIEKQYPTLTILIPELPLKLFSAEQWNTKDQIPAVSYLVSTLADVPIIYANGSEDLIDNEAIPGFPIVLVKENERVAISSSTKSFTNDQLISGAQTITNQQLIFKDPAFNNINPTSISGRIAKSTSTTGIPSEIQKVYDAFDIFNVTGWQRDYIYYNLTKATDKGPFDHRYMEHIVGFQMIGDGMEAIKKICDQPADPKPLQEVNSYGMGRGKKLWTDGELEFKVKVYLGTKSPIGTELMKNIRAKPEELFDLTYTSDNSNVTWLYLKSATPKLKELSLPIFEWDLADYSNIIKIAIEEVDATQTTVSTSSTTVKFASNFEYSSQWGETVKNGTKFGSTVEQTYTNSFSITTTYGNDELGEVVINFGDPIIMDKTDLNSQTSNGRPNYGGRPSSRPFSPNYNTKYSTSWYRIYICPKKMY